MFGIDDAIAVPALASAASGLVNNFMAQDRQDSANAFSAQQYSTRYQTTVNDMKAAGLNPMLAYQGISGSAPSGGIASSSGMPDIGSTMTQAKMASAQVANIAADTENKKAQADLIAGQAAQAWATAGQANANVGLINANAAKVIEETKNVPDQGRQIRQTIELLADQAALAMQKGQTEVEVRRQIEATIAKIKSESTLLNFDIDAARSLGNLGREAGQAKPAIGMIVDLLRMMRK